MHAKIITYPAHDAGDDKLRDGDIDCCDDWDHDHVGYTALFVLLGKLHVAVPLE